MNLPRTAFPMRANLPEREPEFQAFWAREDVYGQLRRERAGRPRFILHDGPPYANGQIHIGTALNKILKDIVVRFANLQGLDAPFVPGWDTHGLPIELRAIQELGLDRRTVDALELRRRCREFAEHYIGVMTRQFQRLGVMGDWEHPYVTLSPDYEAEQVRVFARMALQGYIYKGLKPVYWCPHCQTALADAEIEYQEVTSPSVYVAFDCAEDEDRLPAGTRVLIWTTTPWTLPGNVAIAVHPEVVYDLLDTERGRLLVARPRTGAVTAALGLRAAAVPGSWRGAELEGVRCRHPFLDREVPLVLAEYVSAEEGTGCVHTAPGHGPEDFQTGQRYGLPTLVPVDDQGRLTADAGPFAGLFYREANDRIVAALSTSGHLLAAGRTEHTYPHCWRCKNPVIFRATEQWFASVEGFRRQALAAVRSVRWIPAWGEARIARMIEDRADWCISRQRAWGVPIPAFYCTACGEPLITGETTEAVAQRFAAEGSDVWFTAAAEDLLPPGTACPHCGGTSFRKETDIMDVWFDSGSSHAAVLARRPDLGWPADLYLEGSDQHRGWFQSSLLTAVATRGRAPYRAVLTHGFVVDGEGRKMSKSLGNVVDPAEVVERYGADILRLWVASAEYSGDVRVSPDILRQLADVYRKIRNTLRFLLGNLADFDPDRDALPPAELLPVDRWALDRAGLALEQAREAYAAYQFHRVYQLIHYLCAVDLSAFYLEVSKDRLYAEAPRSRSRRAAQTALYAIARSLAVAIAPILPHTAEEVWQHLPHRQGDRVSIHLHTWPEPLPALSPEERERWQRLLAVRDEVLRGLERSRVGGLIHTSQEAAVEVCAAPSSAAWLEGWG
ncbi:MAG: isoleucine--tRNA ligase, partial [Clostridia bacterium]|nr:isoleucine--tRNA ligase [Clostridia bacterium]